MTVADDKVTNAETINFDLDELTLGELEELEEVIGADGFEGLLAGKRNAKILIAVAYIVKRRDNPEFTLDDARAIKVLSLQEPGEPGEPGKAQGNGA